MHVYPPPTRSRLIVLVSRGSCEFGWHHAWELDEGTKLSTTSALAEMSDKVDEDMSNVELGSDGLGASLRGQLIGLRDERLR